MVIWNWKSSFPFLGREAKKSAHRRADRLSVRLQVNTLESRAVPSAGCQDLSHIGPSDGLFRSHDGDHDHDGQGHHHHHHHDHGHHGNGGGGNGSMPASLSGTVENGRDNSPISGVTVTLTDNTTGATQTTTTDASGNYSFTGLTAGTYTVAETPSPGFQPLTSTAVGSLGGTDGTGQISNIVVTNGANGTGYVLAETQFLMV